MIRLEAGVAGVLVVLAAARSASADEPVGAREPRLMSETAEITSVADAFDGDDPFDLNLLVGFHQSWKNAKIRRETSIAQPGLSTGGFVPATENIASYTSSMSTLDVGADVGIYRDFALILRVPVILSWSQSLGDLNGAAAVDPILLADPQGGTPLFSVPFSSPSRSGIDYISGGLDWAIYNQQRDPTKPTWVIGVEGRLAVGTPLHACNATAGATGVECPDPSNPTVNRDPGISRGMDSVIVRTTWSRRFGYVEPFSGFRVQADFAQQRSDFQTWNPPNDLDRTPPLLGSFMLGLEVVPFEQRESFQRLSADFRFEGTYHSPGRDYSELFDALGSSQAPSLRSPNPSSYYNPNYPAPISATNPSVANPATENVYFSGITEQQAFGSFQFSASATYQAGEYVKFSVGSGFTYAQSHLITAADTCTPNNSDPALAGPCQTTSGNTTTVLGTPNPDHRDVIDLPGHRFSVDDTTIVDLWVRGVVMF
jgi:hypothetical protein